MNELGPVDTSANGSFTGALQTLWDSVSLGALKTCPRYYELSIVRAMQAKAEQEAMKLHAEENRA